MTAADAAAAAAAQIERLTIAGARYAGMGLRAAHLVSLGCAVHDTMQVAPAYAPIHTPKTFSLPNLQWTVGCPLPALPGPAAPPRTDTVTRNIVDIQKHGGTLWQSTQCDGICDAACI